jgi:hypothetical protein
MAEWQNIDSKIKDFISGLKMPQQQQSGQASNSNNFLGSNFDYLSQILKGQSLSGDPNKDKYRETFDKQLGVQTGSAVKNINEQLASSGFRGSGANLIGDVFETQANATQGFENNLLQNDTQIKSSALAQLLGLNQFEGNQKFGKFQSDRQNTQFGQSLDEQRRQFNEQLQYQKDSEPAWWEDMLGTLLSSGARIGAAALSDARLKENIKKVSSKGDIDIVEFNYIGSPKRYLGVTAQQIEANHPEAVINVGGIKFVDYSKIGLQMEEI